MKSNRSRTSLALLVIFVGLLACGHAFGEEFKITIYREYPGNRCTSGYLAVNGRIIVYTLERPWKDNQKNISSIPAGSYSGILRYDHRDHWRIELRNVPGRTNVQIHVGNEPDETKGCILVGTKLSSDLCSIVGGSSTPAYSALKRAFYGSDNPSATPNKSIVVEILDPGRKSPLNDTRLGR